MLTASEIIAIKNRNPNNPDVLALLNEIESQRERREWVVKSIRQYVLPRMVSAREYLRSRRSIPDEAAMLDGAVGKLGGDLDYLNEDSFKVAED